LTKICTHCIHVEENEEKNSIQSIAEKTKTREKQCAKFYEPIDSSLFEIECSDITTIYLSFNFNKQFNYGSIN
jgi:hypothetical protein